MESMTSTAGKILDIAQPLIVRGGYNGFSYADISAAIGIRKASIHHHFPTKAELVSVLVDRYKQQTAEALKALEEHVPGPADQLQAYLDYWQTCILDGSLPFCVCAMLASEIEMLPDPVASRVRSHFQGLAAWLTSVLRAGDDQEVFRLDRPAEEEAHMLMASVHGAMLSARALADPRLFSMIMAPHLSRLRSQDSLCGQSDAMSLAQSR